MFPQIFSFGHVSECGATNSRSNYECYCLWNLTLQGGFVDESIEFVWTYYCITLTVVDDLTVRTDYQFANVEISPSETYSYADCIGCIQYMPYPIVLM